MFFALPLCTLRALFSLTHSNGRDSLDPSRLDAKTYGSLFSHGPIISPWSKVGFGASCEDIYSHSAEHKIKKQLVDYAVRE